MAEREVLSESLQMDDAEIAVVAFGTSARIAKSAIAIARAEGIKAGLIRPVTLFPFPEKVIARAAEQVKQVLVVEMNLGQMVEDVRLAVNGRVPVSFYGRPGGALVAVEDIAQQIRNAVRSAESGVGS
jgi:2-oxoglutarate ferredoxin oxidoreductase subunit alpha